MAKLTPKQEKFIREYLAEPNATSAYKKAGYACSNDTIAGVEGHKLLKNPKIAAELDKLQSKVLDKLEIKAEKVLQEIASIAYDDISNYLDFKTEKVFVGYDANGQPVQDYRTIANVKDSTTINTKNISEISIGKDGQFKFKLYCRDEALVQLGKHLKLFTEKQEITGADGGPIKVEAKTDLSKLTAEELMQLEQLVSKTAESGGD